MLLKFFRLDFLWQKQVRVLWEILVPKCDNSGNEFSLEYHQEWDRFVREESGGLTIMRSAQGQWISPDGQMFREKMIPVRIFCNEEGIDKIIQYTLEYYDQEAVLAYEISGNVKLRHRDPNK